MPLKRLSYDANAMNLQLNDKVAIVTGSSRGIGLVNKIKAYRLQDEGMDTAEANVHLGFDPDPREYGIGAQILRDLGISTMRLITNNPVKRKGIEGYGLTITGRIPIIIPANPHNERYLQTKREKFGHLLTEFGEHAEDTAPQRAEGERLSVN